MAGRSRKRLLPDWIGEKYTRKIETEDTSKCSHETRVQVPNASAGQTTDSTRKTAKAQLIKCSMSEKHELTASEIISSSMEFLHFKGSIIYSFNSADCTLLCEDILSMLPCAAHGEKMHVGFDVEWPVTFKKGSTESKVALIQMCISTDKCYLFHLSPMQKLPSALKTLIFHDNIIKCGINIEADFWKLGRDFGISVVDVIHKSVKDLGKLANAKLKSAERWSLDGLTRNVLRKKLDKNTDIRCGNWDNYPLSEDQKQYAADDVYACLLLANHLMQG